MSPSLASRIHAANTALLVDGRQDAIAEYFATDYELHLTGRDVRGGHRAIRSFLRDLHRAFSRLHVEVEILLKGKDRVAWQRTLRGRHTGAFRGFPPTGRPIAWTDMITTRFRDGLIAEEWAVSDLAERLLVARSRR
jgi:predicted ester cyclase